MKRSLLFPPIFKTIGIVLLLPGLVLGFLFAYYNYTLSFLSYGDPSLFLGDRNLTDELVITLIISGLFFIGFSRQKNEGDVITKLRLNALYWSVVVNCLLVVVYIIGLAFSELFDLPYVKSYVEDGYAIIAYNFFIPLILLVCRFYYLAYKAKNNKKIDPLYFLPHNPWNAIGKIASIPFVVAALAGIVSALLPEPFLPGIDFSLIVFFGFPPFLLLWIWSKEKTEIGLIKNIRVKAMQVAVYINYGWFLIATWVLYGADYFTAMSTCLISIQVIFIAVFYWQLYRLSKSRRNKSNNGLLTA